MSVYVNIICWYKIDSPKDLVLMIPILATLLPIIFFSLGIIDLLHNKLIFNKDGLLVTGQKFKGKIQYKEYIHYSEIVDIRIVCAHMDSKGHSIKIMGIASMRPHIFFEFKLQNGASKLLHIEIYSVRQRKKILEIINQMTNLNFLYSNLENVDQSMFKRKENK